MIKFVELNIKDFGAISEATIPLSDQGLVLVLGENNCSASADSNGAGKSTIFKALTWCLFGECIDGEKSDGIIRSGQPEAVVSVLLEAGEKTVEIRRTRKRGQTQLMMEVNAQDVSAPILAGTQEMIESLLSIDFRTWRNTVLYGQGDTNRFSDPDTSDADRKAILKRILRIDVIDEAQVVAKARLKATQAELADLERKVMRFTAERDALKSVEAVKDEIAFWEQKEAALKNEVSKGAKLRQLMADVGAEIKAIESQQYQAQESLRKIENEAGKKLNSTQGDINFATKQINSLNQDIAQFDEGSCPVCGADSDAGHIQEHIKKCNDEKKQLEAQIAASKKAAAALEASVKAARAKHSKDGAELDEQHEMWAAKLATIMGKANAANAAQRELDTAIDRLKRLRAAATEMAQKVKAIDGQIRALSAAQEDKKAQESMCSFWVDAFGNQGISSQLMDSVVPTLEQRANEYLDVLADGDISVTIDTQKQLKGGGQRDKIEISWHVKGVNSLPPSGGQRKKISIAVDMALMDLVASRERASIDLLLMDEVLDGLDAAGKSRVMDLLVELRKKRNTILVISHDATISELFEKHIKVIKTDSKSEVVCG